MYKRDLITSEIEKLAQVLARIMGLKTALKLEEANDLFYETLLSSFELPQSVLLDPDTQGFQEWLAAKDPGAEKLNTLGDFLFSQLDFENEPTSSLLFAQKLDLLYTHLATKHQVVHLINMGRQKYIQQYL